MHDEDDAPFDYTAGIDDVEIKTYVPKRRPTEGIPEILREYRVYTKEEIHTLKAAGMTKPMDCRPADWHGPYEHSPRHDMILYLSASGMSNASISEELQIGGATVSKVINQTTAKEKIRQLQEKHFGGGMSKRFSTMLPRALDVAEEIMENPQVAPATRLNAASMFMDRALGKPEQKVNVEGNLLSRFIHTLERGDALKDVTPPPSKYDDVFKDMIPNDYAVGKRTALNDGGQLAGQAQDELDEQHSEEQHEQEWKEQSEDIEE